MKSKTEVAPAVTVNAAFPLLKAWDRSRKLEHPNYDEMPISEIVDACMDTYASTLKTLGDCEMDAVLAKENAGRMWRIDLPELTSKHNVIAFIACVAWGQRMRILDAAEVKTMIFMAQTQLSVLKQTVPAGKLKTVEGVADTEPLLPGLEMGHRNVIETCVYFDDPAGKEARK